MGGDTVGSVHFTEYQGVCNSRGLIVCKTMEMGFQIEQSVHIIVDGRISGVSIRWGSTVVHCWCKYISLVPRLPNRSMHARNEGEPWIQCQVCDIGPYTRVRRVANRKKLHVGEQNFRTL